MTTHLGDHLQEVVAYESLHHITPLAFRKQPYENIHADWLKILFRKQPYENIHADWLKILFI